MDDNFELSGLSSSWLFLLEEELFSWLFLREEELLFVTLIVVGVALLSNLEASGFESWSDSIFI